MKFQKVATIDDGITFLDCEVNTVDDETKKLFPDDNLVEIIEDGKRYVVNSSYIILLIR